MSRWVQAERDQVELGLVFVQECYWKDQDGKFWFNDETQSDVCGPFDALKDCEVACGEYAKSLQRRAMKNTVKTEPDTEWIATERSDEAEDALEREYHYHMLRAEELKRFLNNRGMGVD